MTKNGSLSFSFVQKEPLHQVNTTKSCFTDLQRPLTCLCFFYYRFFADFLLCFFSTFVSLFTFFYNPFSLFSHNYNCFKQVLETCVKNCGKRFHLQVTSKDFIRDLVNIIGPKNDPSPALQEKVLSLIQCWADAFKNQPELNGVYQVYVELKGKGIEFPDQDLDAMAPIHTPQRSVVHPPNTTFSSSPPSSHHHSVSRSASAMHSSRHDSMTSQQQHPPALSAGPINLTPDQLAKLHRELSVVQGNITVFEEMLNELTPGNEHPDDYDLLQELNNTCRAMQSRIMDLIDRVTNEEVTVELLRVNDALNNTFVRFDRFIKKKEKIGASGASLQTTEPQFPQHRTAVASTADSLIDFGAEDSGDVDGATAAMTELRLRKNAAQRPVSGGADEFDAFAAARSTTSATSRRPDAGIRSFSTEDQVESSLASLAQAKAQRGVTSAKATSPKSVAASSSDAVMPNELIDKKEDLDEMEKWLTEQEKNTAITTQMVESQDFERFLYERALAADSLPSSSGEAATNGAASTSHTQRASSASARKSEANPFGL